MNIAVFEDLEAQPCYRCGALVFRIPHERTGNKAAIDATPQLGGNVELVAGGKWRQIPRKEVEPDVLRLVNHYVTCPNAADFKRR